MKGPLDSTRVRLNWTSALRAAPIALPLLAVPLLHLAIEVREGDTLGWDQAILLSLRHADDVTRPVGPAWLGTAMVNYTSLGGVAVLLLIVLATVGFLLIGRRPVDALFVSAGLVGGWLCSNALKIWIARPRPDVVTHLVSVADASFPSGHAMVSTATYLTLAAVLVRFLRSPAQKVYVFMVVGLLLCTIGLSRIYLGVHYPTDVFFGWFAGSVWALTCWLAFRRFLSPST
ncbi:undecaprenyl-diphosphatase [Rhizobium sp. BK068]|nr:undecaprenyl-diphosphatase [Rhizobium sp. BK068]